MTKNNRSATVGDVKTIVNKVVADATNAILNGMDNLFEKQNKKIGKMDKGLVGVEEGLGEVKVEVGYIKDELKGIKEEFSDTPSRRQFNTLKSKVDRYHPLS